MLDDVWQIKFKSRQTCEAGARIFPCRDCGKGVAPRTTSTLSCRIPAESLCSAQWWAQLVGARRVHPHKHCANYPPQKDRGLARGARHVATRYGVIMSNRRLHSI